MSLRPSQSRCQLKGQRFVQRKDRRWFLVLPPYYASIFEACCPALMRNARKGFEASPGTRDRVALFSDLEEHAVKTITNFLDFYSRAVCISANRHLKGRFAEELDFCLALDFNKSSPQGTRTQIGEWEYHAKYRQDEEATAELVKALCVAFRWLPWPQIPKPRLITCIPCDPRKTAYLPRTLAKAVVKEVREAFWGVTDPVLKAELKEGKQSAKNLRVDQKIAQWGKIVEAEGIALSRSVKGCSVVVLDDLYQSGASLWSFAKYLKGHGAAIVVGLASVKSLRDTDNK